MSNRVADVLVLSNEEALESIANALPVSVAAEDIAQSVVDHVVNESVANDGHNVGVEGLDVSSSPNGSSAIANPVDKGCAALDIGQLVLCDNRVVCRHHHNELLPSND